MAAVPDSLPPRMQPAHVSDIASANWHATAALAASRVRDGLLVDTGSTTTDLVPFRDGGVTARGYSDGERLTDHELIYAGVVRTPVMAIAREAPFQGRMQGVAAERFATMADVYRLTGDLAHDADPYPTPDHGGKSVEESAARLARMLGRDANEAPLAEWIAAARHFAECQLAHMRACRRDPHRAGGARCQRARRWRGVRPLSR